MQLRPDPKLDYVGVPVITIAGVQLFVPELALRQNRRVVPALIELLPRLDRIKANPTSISEDDYDGFLNVIHIALTRAYPGLTLDELLDEKVSIVEIIGAIQVIAKQTGLFEFKTAPAPGESEGEPAPLTLTESLPDIATYQANPGPTS